MWYKVQIPICDQLSKPSNFCSSGNNGLPQIGVYLVNSVNASILFPLSQTLYIKANVGYVWPGTNRLDQLEKSLSTSPNPSHQPQPVKCCNCEAIKYSHALGIARPPVILLLWRISSLILAYFSLHINSQIFKLRHHLLRSGLRQAGQVLWVKRHNDRFVQID